MDMGTVDVGLVAMDSIRGLGELPWVCSFLRSLSNLKFAHRLKGKGGKQSSCVLARCVIDPGARIKVDTWSRQDRSRQLDNIALLSMFFCTDSKRYAMQQHTKYITILLLLAVFMQISDR